MRRHLRHYAKTDALSNQPADRIEAAHPDAQLQRFPHASRMAAKMLLQSAVERSGYAAGERSGR